MSDISPMPKPVKHTEIGSVKILFMLMIVFLIQSRLMALGPKIEKQSSEKGCFILPILSYTPQTQVAGGILINCYFNKREKTKHHPPSTIIPAVIYTQRKQFSAEISGDFYSNQAEYHVRHYLSYRKFPDHFFGIGTGSRASAEENYTPRILSVQLVFHRRVFGNAYLGFCFEYCNTELIKTVNDGLLQKGTIPGADGAQTMGYGLSVLSDTRDNVFYPQKGYLVKWTLQRFDEKSGSEFVFSRMTADVRGFVPIRSRHILALHGFFDVTRGRVPFNRLPMIGKMGECNLMRGYQQGRYRDKCSWVVQG
ncbi:MAG: BamA/TamA family outer membrane protein, partial [Caldithrix sp.]|nr:BamA/TamA family outer membrane protein [Caldithrix sp.]